MEIGHDRELIMGRIIVVVAESIGRRAEMELNAVEAPKPDGFDCVRVSMSGSQSARSG